MRPRLISILAMVAGGVTEPVRADEGAIIVSGQLRERVTYQSAPEYDREAEAAGWFWTQRASMSLETAITPNLRIRATLLSALIEGGEADSPIERNLIDLQEAYVEIGPDDAFIRLGRQELRLGSQRLLAVRDGTTVRRTWDGVYAVVRSSMAQVDAFALRLVEVEPDGIFNDGRDEGRDIAGVQATVPAPIGKLDAYYILARSSERRTIEGVADERRHSLGLRAHGAADGWFWDWEAVYQTGRFGDATIAAWTLATNTGYRWEGRPWTPEIMLSANIASGDRGHGDGKLGTFSALYPNASYFSENAVLGPANFVNLHPYLRLRPHEDLLLVADINFFWRLTREDGVYGPPGNLLRQPQGVRDRFVDTSLSGVIQWEPLEKLLFSLAYTHSQPQDFIRATGPADPIDFFEATLQIEF